ncbi:signal peptide protein [Robbsia andropogonis]|uniref:Signal peptide protein n=1 Tax=Robbsia andropogonis TaxID=28092 RepID=A0A0F5K4B5_9BURK|nr:DUF4390 domain-containing protein [Robbsia andropogonis]KKB64775.1 signal peptide protein [Robbsia andropogonis]MCP1117793.1 DUF4390 domain-containing protein [Robbsia andropogonis]MCP1127258.1 DUF4390 domain-containing protein [Robbsia andropogonis]
MMFAFCFVSLGVGVMTPASAHAGTIAVQRASLQADAAGGWNLDARFDFTLNNSLTDAVSKGIPLYFRTEFTLTRPRWYWFDDQAVTASQTVRLSFQPLTREYRVSTTGDSLYLSLPTLEQALAVIKHVVAWKVIDKHDVAPGEHYVAAVRMELDISQMPKPFQIDAVNNSDWTLSSDWSRFDFSTADHEK